MAITKIGTPELFDFSATNTALQLPTGDTASRPATPSTGEWRFNTTENYVEFWDSTAWRQIDTEAVASIVIAAENVNTNTYFGNGATQAIEPKFNGAANFSGPTSATVSNIQTAIPGSIFNTNTFSISFWYKRTTAGQFEYMLGTFDTNLLNGFAIGTYNSSDGYRFDILTRNGSITLGRYQGGANVLNVWTNIVMSVDNNDWTFYQDGSLMTDYTGYSQPMAGGTYNNSNTLFLGQPGAYLDEGMYSSFLGQVRVFDTALTDAQVTNLWTNETTTTAATLNFPAGTGCIAAYQLDGNGNDVGTTTATTVATYQLNGPTAVPSIPSNTYPGTPTSITYAAGKFGNAAVFTRSPYISIPTMGVFLAKNTSSISMWIKTSGANSPLEFIFADYAGSSFNHSLSVYPDNTIRRQTRYSGTDSAELSSSAVSLNEWHHVVSVVNVSNNTQQLYVDGSLAATGSIPTGSWSSLGNTEKVIIGGLWGTNQSNNLPFGGEIDQVRIFNSALPASAITALYAETVATSSSASITYVGTPFNGTTTNVGYTGLKFTPGLVWTKSRNTPNRHQLFDSVRGATFAIESDTTFAQSTEPTALTAFNSDGFSLGSSGNVSTLATSYVAWCWKTAASTTTIPASGSQIASDVRANVASGFSVVKYTGTGSTATVGHGLGSVPKLILTKVVSADGNSWACYSEETGIDNYLELNTTAAKQAYTGYWGSATPTTSVFGVVNANFNNNVSGANIIAYCFADISGYQKVGSYTGNGSSTGTIVDTGFTPGFVLIKATTTDGGGGNWIIYDNVRSTSNPRNKRLYPDLSITEQSQGNYDLDFLTGATKGFQPKVAASSYGFNTLNVEYIYLAIA